MRVIVAGSRGIDDPNVVATAIAASGFHVTEVVSGTAHGVDQLGEAWALCRYRHKAPLCRVRDYVESLVGIVVYSDQGAAARANRIGIIHHVRPLVGINGVQF